MVNVETVSEPTNVQGITMQIQNAVDIEWLTLVEIARRFSERNLEDWAKILEHYGESPITGLDQTLSYLGRKLDYIAQRKYVESQGESGPFKLYRLGEKAFKDVIQVDTKIPRSLHNAYSRMARRLGCNLDDVFKVGLRFYMTQKIYQGLTPPDFLKLLVIDAFGLNPFYADDLWSIARYKDFAKMYDPSLLPYVRDEGKPNMDKFLKQLPDGRFQMGGGYGA